MLHLPNYYSYSWDTCSRLILFLVKIFEHKIKNFKKDFNRNAFQIILFRVLLASRLYIFCFINCWSTPQSGGSERVMVLGRHQYAVCLESAATTSSCQRMTPGRLRHQKWSRRGNHVHIQQPTSWDEQCPSLRKLQKWVNCYNLFVGWTYKSNYNRAVHFCWEVHLFSWRLHCFRDATVVEVKYLRLTGWLHL